MGKLLLGLVLIVYGGLVAVGFRLFPDPEGSAAFESGQIIGRLMGVALVVFGVWLVRGYYLSKR